MIGEPSRAAVGLKRGVLRGAQLLGINRALRSVLRRRLLVLCYHGVIDDGGSRDELRYSTTVGVTEFRNQLQILKRFFNPVSAAEVLEWLRGAGDLPPSPVLLTFDDGFRNNLRYAAPELVRVGTPALVHIATGYIGTGELLWPQELVERILRWPGSRLPWPEGPDIELSARPADRQVVATQLRCRCKALPDDQRLAFLDRLRDQPLDRSDGWDDDLYAFLS